MLVSSIYSLNATQSEDSTTKEFVDYSTKKIKASSETQAELTNIEEHNKEIKKDSLSFLANKICTFFILAAEGSNEAIDRVAFNFENTILDYINVSRDIPKEKKEKVIGDFLNKNSKYLLCTLKEEQGRPTEHIFKCAIRTRLYPQVFFRYLLSFKNPQIDFNATEKHNGKNETVLDYLDRLIASEGFEESYYENEVKRLRRTLAMERFGAKTAADLD
jgi:hypothetical protein